MFFISIHYAPWETRKEKNKRKSFLRAWRFSKLSLDVNLCYGGEIFGYVWHNSCPIPQFLFYSCPLHSKDKIPNYELCWKLVKKWANTLYITTFYDIKINKYIRNKNPKITLFVYYFGKSCTIVLCETIFPKLNDCSKLVVLRFNLRVCSQTNKCNYFWQRDYCWGKEN